MGKSYTLYTAGEVADNALSIVGAGNTIAQDKSIQMQDDTRIIGGNSNEMAVGSTLNQLEANAQLGGYRFEANSQLGGNRVGDNSSLSIVDMDEETQNLLLEAFSVVGQNANNMMALAAGRNPDSIMADSTSEIKAEGKTNPLLAFVNTKSGRVTVLIMIAASVAYFWKGKKK